MRLIVHPGYPKTATSWLQDHALPEAGVWLLGKGSAGDGSQDYWNTEVYWLKYNVFRPVYRQEMMWERYRNSGPLVRAYAQALAGQLNDADAEVPPASAAGQRLTGTDLAVLSDETILGYGGVEVNAPLLSYLLSLLKSYAAHADALELEVVLTIREQSSFLQSVFAYDYVHLRERYRTFDDFVDACIREPNDDVFGTLFYDDVLDLLSATLPPFVSVRVVPFETLARHGAARLLDDFLDTASLPEDVHLPRVSEEAGNRFVNDQQDSGYRLRGFSRRHQILRGVPYRLAGFAPPPVARILRAGINSKPMLSLAPSEATHLLDARAELNTERRLAVRAVYAENNRRLQKRLGLDLEELGYPV